MPSILEYSEKKKKRVFATQSNSATPGPPAKRQKVSLASIFFDSLSLRVCRNIGGGKDAQDALRTI